MRVVVLGGGRSEENAVSLASAAAVRDGLQQGGHDTVAVEITRDGRWLVDGGELTLQPAGGLLGCDVVFPALHGPYGEDGVVQGVLECLDVAYVGSGVASSAICIDKVRSKDLFSVIGIPQVAYRAVQRGRFATDRPAVLAELAGLSRPVFVKPARLGSSVGIAKVGSDEAELVAALEGALALDELAIVEAMASGIEVECSVLGDTAPRASTPGEIVLHSDFYDYAAKYEAGGMELVVPARISTVADAKLRSMAVDVFRFCGCADLARVDFFVDGDEVLLNELNTMPGFTPTSVYAKLWETSGVGYADLVEQLCALALARHNAPRNS
jgi:D-alanine-D-alanine ligase